ncbi:MAG: HAMP domain-containing sensor histidine kinase [Vicinamibacterales bacterium]
MTESPWRRRFNHAVGLRVAVWYAVLFVVSALAIGAIGYQLLAISLVERDHGLLRIKLAEYSARYESGGLASLSDAVGAEQASGDPDSVLVRLVAPNADVLLLSPTRMWQSFDDNRLNAALPSEALSEVSAPGLDTTLEVVSRPLWDGTIIQVGRTTRGRDQFLAEVRKVFGLLMIAVVTAGLAGGVALTHQALRPLRDVVRTAREIARTGEFHARVEAGPEGDLVDELGRVFNTMLERIDTLIDGMRGALDNVAHDLRTPVARLRARAEAALTSGGREADTRAALAECVEEADRVTELLTTLLDISEAQTGTMRLTLEDVPVPEVARETIDLYEDIAEDKGVALTSRVPAGAVVRADRQRLRQVLANLVDNALKHTDAGGRVEIGAETGPAETTITVADTGTGIAPGDLPRIWERLYRADQSRGSPGLGLGLSLVRAIAAAHGGRAEATSEPGRGATFRITLPTQARGGGDIA